MIGLYCHDGIISIIPCSNELSIISSNNNSKCISKLIEYHEYEQPCCFCYNNITNNKNNECFLNNMIIILSCNHIFHLNCFMNYCKFNYIKKLNNCKINCIICRKETPDYLSIFTEYSNLINYIKNKHKQILGQIL
jgi:hypothetical protein